MRHRIGVFVGRSTEAPVKATGALLEAVRPSNTKVTDAGLKHLDGLTELVALNLNGTSVTDARLERLEELTGIQALS